jgi:RAB protein geranylgeranyltransferase component A
MTQRINNNIDTIINLINTRFETEYNQAAAVNKLIELTKTDSEWKSIVKEEVDKILRPDNSDEVVPMEELRNQIQEKVQKLMATY